MGVQVFLMTLLLGGSVEAEDIGQMGLEVNTQIRALLLPFSCAMMMAGYLAQIPFFHF